MDPTARFAELVAAGCEPLDEAALVIAAHAHGVDVSAQLDRLDVLADDAGAAGATRDPAALCRYLFVDLGFAGNRTDYYDPANSFLDEVLDRRIGIPISLSVVAMEVGRRCGVGFVGVGMPGHFLIRAVGDPGRYFDPFSAGAELDVDGCENRFRMVAGDRARLSDADLLPSSAVEIVGRMLANLHRIYLDASDQANLAWALRLRTMLPGAEPSLRRQLAGVLSDMGRFWQAADELDALAQLHPAGSEQHREAAERLRANLN